MTTANENAAETTTTGTPEPTKKPTKARKPKATKKPTKVMNTAELEAKRAEILAEMEATKAKATAPIETLPGETPDNPKFVKASIKARKKALADMAAAKAADDESDKEFDAMSDEDKKAWQDAAVKATKEASKAPKDTVPEPDLTSEAQKALERAALVKAVRAEAKAKGISLTDDGGEIKTRKMLQKEIDALPKVKKLLPKGTNAKRKLIKAAMSEFPATFSMVDYEGHKLTLSRDDSDADLKTEKVMLAVLDAQGNVVAKHSPKMLHAIVIGGKKASKVSKGPKAPRSSKPHVKGERKTESNIPLMMRLLREGKTQEQIFTEFRSRYTEQNVEHKDESWTWDRVVIYHKIAFGKLSKDERKSVPTSEINKPKKNKASKPSKKADKATPTEKPTKKKGKDKTPKEPKADGVSKAERKAKQKAKAEATDSVFASKLALAEAALDEAKKTKAEGATIVRLARELKELKESNEPCVACSGKGKSSKGDVCSPCKGSGKKGMAI